MTITHPAGPAAGERLKRAREAAGLSLAELSTRTRLTAQVLQTLEEGDWDRLGPPVFVRGQARSYARALGIGLDDDALPSPFTTTQIPSLVSHAHVPRYRHVAENLARRAVYIVMTCALVVPIWMSTRGHGDTPAVASLDVAPSPTDAASARVPMVASITPLPSAAPALAPVAAATLDLQFASDSWVQLFAPDGRVVEKGLVRAGERRSLAADAVGRLVVGNATGVQARIGGRDVDLTPYTRANVARFTLSSDGSLARSAP